MKSFFSKKIPTLAGILLLLVAVATTSYLVNTGIILFGGASPSDNPQNVRITNVSDTTFTVTYTTAASVIGSMALSVNGKSQTILDERDQVSGVPQSYVTHTIAVKNATPTTSYNFSLTSGATIYQNNGSPFSVATGPALTASPSATSPASGKILDATGNPAANILVYITTQNGQTLSTTTNAQGQYIIPLNALRTADLSDFLPLADTTILQILATNGTDSSQAQIKLLDANPVPLITLGNNYNFVTGTKPIASTSASLGFPPFPTNNTLTATPLIITPKKDQGFTDAQPQFSGKALPDQPVQIEIHSDAVITATVTSDSNGNWTYRPATPLSPGQHILSITTKDASGILKTIQQSFVVYASGSQVTQSATPSATLAPTKIPTAAPTTTVSPTVSPTILTPTPTLVSSKLTPKPTLPPTGSNSLVVSTFFGIATAVAGVVLFVIAKGATL